MGLRPSSLPPLLPENEQIASQKSFEDFVIEEMSAGICTILIFDGTDGCFDCRLSSTSGVMLHNMSYDATLWTAAGTSLVVRY